MAGEINNNEVLEEGTGGQWALTKSAPPKGETSSISLCLFVLVEGCPSAISLLLNCSSHLHSFNAETKVGATPQ